MQKLNEIIIVSCMKPDSKTGVTTYYNLLLKNFKDSKISLLTPADAPWFIKKVASAYYQFFSFLFPKKKPFIVINYYRFLLFFLLKRSVKSEKGILFHAQDPISAFVIRKLFKSSRIITTCHFNDDPVTEFKLQFDLDQKTVIFLQEKYKKYFKATDEFICVSNYVAKTSKFLMPAEAKISIIHNAIDFKKIEKEKKARNNNKIIISNCGTLENRKNQILLIEVAKELIDSNFRNFQIWLIGTGPNFDLYKNLIDKYQLEDYVLLQGWQEAPWKQISKSNIYIHTALNENFGYTILEAIAAGAFTVAINAGGIPEILESTELIPLKNAKEIIYHLIKNFNYRNAELSAKIQYARAFEKFGIKSWTRKHFKLYEVYNT